MGLYLGSSGKQKINLNGIIYDLILFSTTPVVNGDWLISSDNYILKDSSGIYLIPSDYTPDIISENILLSSDGCILQDSKGLYLIFEESE